MISRSSDSFNSYGKNPEEMRKYIEIMFVQLDELKEELRRSNAIIAENAVELKRKTADQKHLNEEVLSLTKNYMRLYWRGKSYGVKTKY